MAKHRPIDFVEDVNADLDNEVRADTEDVAVEGGVVELAEAQAIRHHGRALRVAIREDMGGVEQFPVSELAHGTGLLVGVKYPLAKAGLVKALEGDPRHVSSPRFVHDLSAEVGSEGLGIVHSHGEGERRWIVAHDEHGPLGQVLAWQHAMEIDQRSLLLHRSPQTHILMVEWVDAPVPVTKEPVLADLVLVGPLPSLDHGHRGDAEGDARGNNGWLEDSLRTHQWDPIPLKLETSA
jgi:hypothetical protein